MDGATVVIIGAGPGGLTAAHELIGNARARVIVLEASNDFGGISKTVEYKGNRIDIGGHRFFSKSDWVMDWWQNILPISAPDDEPFKIAYQNKQRLVSANGAAADDENVMLVRSRLSRIYYEGKFYSYPIKADVSTALNLGPARVTRMMASYVCARATPIRPESSLEDFMINRFGRELYETFFKDYTEKVWGVPCTEIGQEWGAQRIKGLSVSRAIAHALSAPVRRLSANREAKNTSLIESFLYPKYGPGQMWETVAGQVRAQGGEIRIKQRAVGIEVGDGRISAVIAQDMESQEKTRIEADYVISTMPVRELVDAMADTVPNEVRRVADGLQYRDFVTVGLLLRKLKPTVGSLPNSPTHIVPDNWIYVQDKGVSVGRLQIFNNWSPWMVADPNTVWIGMEYFCAEGDDIWSLGDENLKLMAVGELETLGLAGHADLLDGVVLRVPKAYPGYYGTYSEFPIIRDYMDTISNLFLVGRNGMHRYNNQDHSMLTARYAVQAILENSVDKQQLWDVNVDDEYHEEKVES